MSTVTTEKTRRSRSWNLQSIFTLKFRSSSYIKPSRKHYISYVTYHILHNITYVNTYICKSELLKEKENTRN